VSRAVGGIAATAGRCGGDHSSGPWPGPL